VAKVIRVNNVSKKYDRSASVYADSLRETLSSLIRNPFSLRRKSDIATTHSGSLWALRDVSFEVEAGDVMGVIGRNGAGKSTLLKILSRITEPTAGSIEIHGRVGSLLEVGTGFHPELTGRENIFLSGAILGMKRDEIKRKFDCIVDFSEMEQFLDMPVKRYSSGMYVRLAFAVAAHLDPEVLVIDEVLAVGDVPFQKKCMDKMREVTREGRTILLVSHNMNAVLALCNKAVLLDSGSVTGYGDVFKCVNKYAGVDERLEVSTWCGDIGDENIRLYNAQIVTEEGRRIFMRGDTFFFDFTYEVMKDSPFVVVGIDLFNNVGIFICASRYTDFITGSGLDILQMKGRHTVRIQVNTSILSEGEYYIKINLGLHNMKRIIENDPIISFTVVNPDKNLYHDSPLYKNLIYPDWTWEDVTE
jgi:lipopolysaccharide transport system ATP-binding protein